MFDNMGGKIKILAQVTCWLGIICSVISGFILGYEADSFLVGLLIIVLGSLTAWTSSFTLYGFGELVENSEIANSNTYKIHKLLTRIAPEEKKNLLRELKHLIFLLLQPPLLRKLLMVVGFAKNVAQKMIVMLSFAKIVEHTNKFYVKDIFLCLSFF